ncbi:MAG: hypothetical protein ACREQY_11005, partial [Candidatus Binatia bacterium]
ANGWRSGDDDRHREVGSSIRPAARASKRAGGGSARTHMELRNDGRMVHRRPPENTLDLCHVIMASIMA